MKPPTDKPDWTREAGKPRYIMIGGFLGAGKTTALARLGARLSSQGYRVGLITNDQGSGLVDTAMLRSRGFATEEIPGGCFCCRFNSLLEAAERLTQTSRPDIFLAEPVGSCTDLVATVNYPLRRIYGADFSIAPLSVLVDPIRAERVLGLEPGPRFSDKVLYIYRKQIEEANIIVINKTDLLSPERLERLQRRLREEYPHAAILAISARSDSPALDPWFDLILRHELPNRAAMQLDYETYAEGEALLGWLNCQMQISTRKGFDGNELLRGLALDIQQRLRLENAEIAHLKITLNPEGLPGELGVVNLVRNDFIPELSQELSDIIDSAEIILNLRAEAAPEVLHQAVNSSLTELAMKHAELLVRVDHLEHFRPGKPQPSRRFESLAVS